MLKKNVANEVPEAITALAVCYRDGDYGLVKSAKKAAKLYKRAVELGDVKAMTSLGVYYKNGNGVKMDEAKAKQLYRMAADRGDYIAQMNLGGLLLAEKNDDEAYRWFLLAAQQGFTAAELQVGIAHGAGWGVAKDYVEAKRWFLRAAAKGCERAKGYLEQMDCKKAIRQSRPAADQGDVQAQYTLGNFLSDHGKELEDRGEHEESIAAYEESVRYLTLAAAQNYGEAQHNLALAYAEGRGVEQDLAATVPKLYERAADLGNVRAMTELGTFYVNGDGVKLDKRKGMALTRTAADRGFAMAQHNLAVQLAKDSGVFGAESHNKVVSMEIIRLYRLAAEQGYTGSENNLGNWYMRGGLGVDQDIDEAVFWYRRAARKGHKNASSVLTQLGIDHIKGQAPSNPRNVMRESTLTSRARLPATRPR
ncbi:hypothetical protein AURANDRAFT_27530 [Aureococcus anophagefferens]|uniref:Uncharacterized protein n=1 Tax=Aureococcus anophagefferens TaxID=44056 RepID=F0YBB6_AURAN|nr:hypothetical protein AURANDRAFT_27530 [Aureococcus anophagefferens]EGB07629.1 hypothetical protein AURANDRAFT_27530 [Aureococcus anophagefferens]|eukprot:XP_009037627.1 hypothetical protein AURANDRAFT_27530 [Aureococcus anophagefferens]